jgi:hypothetical protein
MRQVDEHKDFAGSVVFNLTILVFIIIGLAIIAEIF